MSFSDILILFVLILVLFFAVLATLRGYKGIKMSKRFETTDKKVKVGYWLISAIHMVAGILIIIIYIIAGIFILLNI